MPCEPKAMAPRLTLAETQAFLGDLVRRADSLGSNCDTDLHAGVFALVAGNERLTPLEQAEIYREQFWLRHRDSLEEDFPALAQFLGADAFQSFARAYLAAVPPSSWTLRDLGLALPQFADGHDGFAEGSATIARELARFDLGFITVFDAAAAPPVDAAKVAAIAEEAWAGARIVLQPGLALFTFKHAIHEFRSAVRQGEDPQPKSIAARPVRLALYRGTDLRVHQAELTVAEHALLVALREGAPLSAACERALLAADNENRMPGADSLDPGEVEAKLGGWFAAWAARGWVTDVVTSP